MSEFKIPIAKPQKFDPVNNPWFWNPNRLGVKGPQKEFQAKLESLDPNLSTTWNPIMEKWMLWVRAPRLRSPLCQGWRLLFIHHDGQGGYLPLDERFLARLYSIDASRVGNAKQYFDRITREAERDKERADKQWQQDTIDAAMPSWEYSQIKNIGKGSKFSEYFS